MLFPCLLLILLLEEVVAGNGQGRHQHDKLVEIHLVVLVGIQVVHDFLHQHRILLGLQTKGRTKRVTWPLPTEPLLASQRCGVDTDWSDMFSWCYGWIQTDVAAQWAASCCSSHLKCSVLLFSFRIKIQATVSASTLFLMDIWIFPSRVFALVRA